MNRCDVLLIGFYFTIKVCHKRYRIVYKENFERTIESRAKMTFEQVVSEIIQHGHKITSNDFLQLYQQYSTLSNVSQQELEQFQQQITSCINHQVNQLLFSSNNNITIELVYERVQNCDKLCKRLFKSRKWLLASYPQILITGTLCLRQALIQMEHICTLQDSLCNCDMCGVLAKVNNDIQLFRQEQDSSLSQQCKATNIPEPMPRYRFTRTKNDIKELEVKFNSTEKLPIIRRDLPSKDNRVAFVLENVFSPDECKVLIQKSKEVGYSSLEAEFVKEMRDNQRVLISSPDLASELWNRIKPFVVTDKQINGMSPFGFNSQGKWVPCRLNPCFRFCAYFAPCVGFLPHRDASFVASSEERSCLTCMLYLNDDFVGGTTNFMSSTGCRMDETIKEEMERGYTVDFKLDPKPGMCIIFDHMILHEGAPVTQGEKFIARTDLVFHRYENNSPSNEWQVDPNYRKMVRYYKQAAEAECQGDVTLSSELYERALSIRQGQKATGYTTSDQ
jgi:hypothetical protein